MTIDSIASASTAQAQSQTADSAQMSILKQTMDLEKQMMSDLLKMMGVGQNIDTSA